MLVQDGQEKTMGKRTIVTAAVLLMVIPSLAAAQATGTGSVVGRITDPSNAVLPGVTVTLKSAEALGQYTAVTDAQGTYRVANLPPATYEARAELQGLQTAVQKVAVRINSTVTVDFTLPVGAMSETVTVSGEAPIIDRERAGLAVTPRTSRAGGASTPTTGMRSTNRSCMRSIRHATRCSISASARMT